MKHPFLAALALLAAASAQAADWQAVTTEGDKKVLVDTASIQAKGEVTRFWWKLEAPAPAPDLAKDGVSYQFLSTLSEADCVNKTLRHRERVRFNATGPFVYAYEDPDALPAPIAPGDNPPARLLEFVCAHRPAEAAPAAAPAPAAP